MKCYDPLETATAVLAYCLGTFLVLSGLSLLLFIIGVLAGAIR